MKKMTMIFICVFAAVASFAEEIKSSLLPSPDQIAVFPQINETRELKRGLLYVRFLAADPSILTQYQVHPGMGFGYRKFKGSSAFDIVATMTGHKGYRRGTYTWTVPKASYLHYLDPQADQTMYLGAGMSFGGIERERKINRDREREEFIGLLGHLTAGVELFRRDACVVMSEFCLSQPLIPANQPNAVFGPSAELSCGLGF